MGRMMAGWRCRGGERVARLQGVTVEDIKSVKGVVREGKVELLEPPPWAEETRVIVTNVPVAGPVDLPENGIGPEQAADLRSRLRTFREDWERPEMDAYDAL